MTTNDTSALDLDAIDRRILAAPLCDCGRPSTQWCADSECGAESCDGHARQTGALGHEHRWTRYPIATEDAVALTAEVRRLTAANERLRAAARGVTDGFLAMLDDIRTDADDAARTANAERVRSAVATLVAEVSK